MIIDSHHHLWDPSRGDYGWMPKDDPILSRVYSLREGEETFAANGVAHTVVVQAAPTVAESDYLLSLADQSDVLAGVVGWIDFEDASHRAQLDRLAAHPKFRSVRPMVQDISDNDWVLRPEIRWAFDALLDLDLAFDALGFPRHIARFREIFQRYPDLRVVIDHCLKPEIALGAFDEWAREMEQLAHETNALCKLSGLVTEAGEDHGEAALKPYVEHVVAVFGAERIMWGSDWPVCRLKTEYGDWLSLAKSLTDHLPGSQQQAIFGGNCRKFYKLSTRGS